MSTRKLLISLVILISGGAGIYWFFFYSARNYPEKILPENTAAYLFFSGVDQIREEASKTLLWKKIEASPRKQIYVHQMERLMRFTESVTGVDPRPLFSQFSREVALAVMPVTGATQSGSLIAYIRKEKQTREFLEMKLDPALKRRFPDLRKTTVTYQNREYFKYSSQSFKAGVSPCYAFLDHHLILTSSEVGMKILFDVKANKLRPLKKNDSFQETQSELHFEKGLFFFLNAKSTLDALRNRLTGRVEPYWPVFLKITGVEAVRGFGYSLGPEGDGFREDGFVFVDRKRQGLVKAYMEQRPQKLSGLIFLPSSSQAAGAGTLPDGVLLWKEVQSQIDNTQLSQWKSFLEIIGAFLNFDFQKDLVEPVGNQFSFAYDSTGTKLEPHDMRYLIAVEIKKPEHFRSVVEKLILLGEQRGFQRKTELYQGKNLQILDVRIGGMQAMPALWMEGSWFYFGTHQDFVKQSIDAMRNKTSLPESSDFKKVTSGFPAELNSISYTNNQATLHRYATMLQEQSENSDRAWIREYGLLEELDDLSKSLFGSGSYTLIEKDGVRYRAYSSVPASFLLLGPILSTSMSQ